MYIVVSIITNAYYKYCSSFSKIYAKCIPKDSTEPCHKTSILVFVLDIQSILRTTIMIKQAQVLVGCSSGLSSENHSTTPSTEPKILECNLTSFHNYYHIHTNVGSSYEIGILIIISVVLPSFLTPP